MIYRDFIIKKITPLRCVLYSKDNKKLTEYAKTSALKKLVDKFYNNDLNEFEKNHIFKGMVNPNE